MRLPRQRAWKAAGFLLIQALFLALVLIGPGKVQAAGESAGEKQPAVALLPRVGIGLEYGGLLVRRGDFSSAFRYRFLIDLFQFGRHLIFTEFDGEISFGIPGESLAFNRIRHFIPVLGYRYDLGNHYLGAQFYHRCYNPFRGPKKVALDLESRTVATTYFAGLEFVDKALLVGQEDRGIVFDPDRPFEFLGRFHVAVNLNRVIVREDTRLNWLFTGRVRLDLLRFHNLVPYVEAGGEVLGQGRWDFIPKVEAGVRIRGKNLEFTPLVQWGHTQEWLRAFVGEEQVSNIRFESRSYLFAGGRLVFLLDQESLARQSANAGREEVLFFPEVHGQAFYGLNVGSRYNLGAGGLALNLDILRWRGLSLFANPRMRMDSISENLSPDKITCAVDYGLRYDRPKWFLEGFVRHATRLDVYEFHVGVEGPNLAGGRVGTRGMRLGHYDDGISFTGPEFQWLHNFNGQVSLAHYFDTFRWPCTWNVAAQGRWDLLRWRRLVPYVEGGVEWLDAHRGLRDAVEYYVEPGLRFHGVFDLAVFARWHHRETIFSFRGPAEDQKFVGVRALF